MPFTKTKTTLERFEAMYIPEPNSGCWLWTGACRTKNLGYGILRVGGKNIAAHRLSYEMFVGPIEPTDLYVCHKCDNPYCVNPKHLFLGTARDNVADMKRKNRQNYPTGEDNHASKLTQKQADEMRSLYGKGHSQKEIAEKFGISQSHTSEILAGKYWNKMI